MSTIRPPPDSLEHYKRLNSALVIQLQEYKQRQRVFETRLNQLLGERMQDKQTIREQATRIERFVNHNSADLNEFLSVLFNGHNDNMTLVAQFVQRMLKSLESLLQPHELPAATSVAVPAASPPKLAARFPPRAHRSLSPVAQRDETRRRDPEDADDDARFVTKRRRNYSPRTVEAEEEEENKKRTEREEKEEEEEQVVVQRVKVPPSEPVTLPDGMLSTLAETSTDDERSLSLRNHHVPDDSLVEVEEQDEQVEQEEEDEESEDESEPEAVEGEEEEDEQQVQEAGDLREEDKENEDNLSINENALVASSTPIPPRRKVVPSRELLSPIDQNRLAVETPTPEQAAKQKTRRRKETPLAPVRKKRGAALEPEEQDENEDSNLRGTRPRRKAAPKVLVEASLQTKLRR